VSLASAPHSDQSEEAKMMQPRDLPNATDRPEATATDENRIVARPDGFYWIADEGRQEFGPFESAADALADLRAAEETGLEPAETLQEAEGEVGIAEWIDPETGEPGEETRPRIEQH
jgi:hypothetical protein